MKNRERPLRVAIVGLGPKGLFALERLIDAAGEATQRAPLEVDLFEPHASPGAGPVYNPSQPGYLRMNLGAASVSIWQYGNRCVPPPLQLDFVHWREQTDAGPPGGSYPPRAQVGRYLCESLETLRSHLPADTRVELRRERVERVRRADRDWELLAAGRGTRYDEVLLSCGHQSSWGGGLGRTWSHRAQLVESVFPVEHQLTVERVPAGSVVGVRGFGLTFIDAALALSEGRGGRFEALAGATPALRYLPSGLEPRVILPFARTGRPMHSKSAATVVDALAGLDGLGRAGRRRIEGLGCGLDIQRQLLPILADTASACLAAAGAPAMGEERGRVEGWLRDATRGEPETTTAPLEAMERSLLIGAGAIRPDAEWALARSWLLLYPTLAPRLGGDTLDPAERTSYRCLAREMERIAFGPPPVNAAKLVALASAGLVDLRHLRGGVLRTLGKATALDSAAGPAAVAVDHVIDAVLPEAGALGSHHGLLAELLERGWARIATGRRGIEIAGDASCLGADGTPTPGLAAIGRPTEDSVIDNDTLSRDRHPHPGRWAQRVVGQARLRQDVPAAGARSGR